MAERTLEYTPTWAVAVVCTVFIAFSLLLVYGIEKFEHKLKESHRKHLVRALDKMKEELMLLGFISLLLTVFQSNLSGICVRKKLLESWSFCRTKGTEAYAPNSSADEGSGSRRLLTHDTWPLSDWEQEPIFRGRMLVVEGAAKTCKPGHEPLLTGAGLAQLHIFIFVLACVHVVYSLIAMILASLKVNGWRVWEDEAQADSDNNMAEITKSLTLRRQTTFVQYHAGKSWSTNQFGVWVVCFFRQFGQAVTRADYLSLRLGFVLKHNTGKKFDFHKYLIRSMEDEYQRIVGVSVALWFFVVLFLLFNIDGTNLYFWLSIVPVVVVLMVGAKLQHIIATLALENAGITQGGHLAGQYLKPRDDLFWFRKPQLILWLIHFVLFQNAFEMATFLWFLWQFGANSCLLRQKGYVYIRVAFGITAQILCSYSTLPLYTIVTQMGSHYKQAIFQHHVKDKLHHWRDGARKRAKLGLLHEEGSSIFSDRSLIQSGKPYDSSFTHNKTPEASPKPVESLNNISPSIVEFTGGSGTGIRDEPFSPIITTTMESRKDWKFQKQTSGSAIHPVEAPPFAADGAHGVRFQRLHSVS